MLRGREKLHFHKRVTGLEPVTLCLGSIRSTTELHPQTAKDFTAAGFLRQCINYHSPAARMSNICMWIAYTGWKYEFSLVLERTKSGRPSVVILEFKELVSYFIK